MFSSLLENLKKIHILTAWFQTEGNTIHHLHNLQTLPGYHTMASRHPLDSANRPLAIDRPLIQYPRPNQSTGENLATGISGSAHGQCDQAVLADDLSSLFAKTVDILRSINHKIHEVGTSHESHSASALLRH